LPAAIGGSKLPLALHHVESAKECPRSSLESLAVQWTEHSCGCFCLPPVARQLVGIVLREANALIRIAFDCDRGLCTPGFKLLDSGFQCRHRVTISASLISGNAFAMVVGGGIDIPVRKSISVRPMRSSGDPFHSTSSPAYRFKLPAAAGQVRRL
jgi:hypothetical protein